MTKLAQKNEPENLKAVAGFDLDKEILLLHANTMFESKRTRLPSHSARGKEYDLTELIPEKALPRNVHFVWHGVNDEVNLHQFLASDIRWAECDVHLDPTGSDFNFPKWHYYGRGSGEKGGHHEYAMRKAGGAIQ